MTIERSDGGGQVFSLAEIAADDALLDALGDGLDAPADDSLAGMLHAWRADLESEPADLAPIDLPSAQDAVPLLPRRKRWPARLASGVAAAALVAGGLAIAGSQAGPDSPLWPIAQVVSPEQADIRLVEHTIRAAAAAAKAHRYDDARRLLDRAATQVGRVRDPQEAQRLRDRIDEIRRSLPTVGGAPTPTPQGATPTPSGAGTTGPGGTTPGGADSGTPGGSTPGLPIDPPIQLPVPVPPVPVPPVPVPTLPAVPVPTLPAVPVPTLPGVPTPPLGG